MSWSDKKMFYFICENCGSTETVSLKDYGSQYVPHAEWESGKAMRDFAVSWSGGGTVDPEVEDATCKKCDSSNVSVSSEYKPFG